MRMKIHADMASTSGSTCKLHKSCHSLIKQCWCRAIERSKEIADIKQEVEAFGSSFPMPGFHIDAKANGHA